MQRTLYHFPLSPFSRRVRVALVEKKLEFDLVVENFWERRREFLAMNPAAQVPVLVEQGKSMLSDSNAICEYLDEAYPVVSLLGHDPLVRAEARRVAAWFNNKFYYEVTKYILDEKLFKHLRKQGEPCTQTLRVAKSNMTYHLDYIAYLRKRRKWLAGDQFSHADVAAACHISVLDYFYDVPWEYNQDVKEWYALVKSRPSFRAILEDRIPGFKPPRHYENPDF